MPNLTGVPSMWDDLSAGAQANQQALSAEELAKRKKKILAAGTDGAPQSAAQALLGTALNSMGSPRA